VTRAGWHLRHHTALPIPRLTTRARRRTDVAQGAPSAPGTSGTGRGQPAYSQPGSRSTSFEGQLTEGC